VKTLLVLRHAKSDYPPGVEDDFARPLAKRGRKDLLRLAGLLRAFGPVPDLVLSSPALRARQTAEGLIHGLELSQDLLRLDERLYLAEPEALSRIVSELPPGCATALVVAHNPGLEAWIERLCGARVCLPTAGLASLELDAVSWEGLQEAQARLQWLVIPRLLKAIS
jgi:phosphohistidine phosphatase